MLIRPITIAALVGFTLLTACSKNEEAASAASSTAAPATVATAPAAPQATQASAGDVEKGEKVYKSTCAMCHGTGAGGAPMFKSKDDWAPRIAQGKDTLYDHALHGFSGSKGTMPAKGGNASLGDEDVKAGVDYMTSKAT